MTTKKATSSHQHDRLGPLRSLRRLSALALVATMGALPATASASAPSQAEDTGLQYVNAVADASLVHLKVKWNGWVTIPRDTFLWGTSADYWTMPEGIYGPYAVTTTCSGFVASATGDVVTAGHCVDDETYDGGKNVILSAFVTELGQSTGASQAEMAEGMANLRANADVEGLDAGSPPDREVRVTAPALSRRGFPASVVDVQSFRDGDVALLSVTGLEAPVLPVAETTPDSGANVVAAGFAGGVAEIVDSESPPTFNPGTISGTETVNGTPFTSISARTSPGMSGGPVLNMDGEVVGTVSWAQTNEADRSSDFIGAAASIQSILAGNGVDNTLGPADLAYREGLSAFYESRYHDAVAKFDEAQALQPGWRFISEVRQDAVTNYPNDVAPPEVESEATNEADAEGGGGVPTWAYVLGGGAVLVMGAAGALGALVVRRRRHAPPQTAPTPAPETVPTAPAVTAPAVTASAVGVPPTGHGFCSNCGAEHELSAHYCEACGQPFAAALSVEHHGV
jgi:serine protease Do